MKHRTSNLTIEQMEDRCPNMVKGQELRGVLTKYWFICETHGRYKQIYFVHQRGSGCPKCGRQKLSAAQRLTVEEMERTFPDLEKGQEPQGANVKYWFICDRHGRYQQLYGNHLRGSCPKCGRQRTSVVNSLTIEEMECICPDMEKGQEPRGVRGKYWFICEKHGRYPQKYQNHRMGHRCPKCGRQKLSTAQRLSAEEMERIFPDLEKGQAPRGTLTRYWFICEQHGRYEQLYSNHQRGSGCPVCSESKGEKALAKAAKSLELTDYEKQKRFSDCRRSRPLPFDGGSTFARILFEYHGEQHYVPVERFGGIKTLRRIRKHDRIKRNWARRNGWHLIVVPYQIKNVESYLRKRIPGRVKELPIAA